MNRWSLALVVFLTLVSGGAWASEAGLVEARRGLVVRAGPGRTHPQVTVVPYGSRLAILEGQGPEETIEGKRDRWVKVSFAGREGWAFGGFIRQETGKVAGPTGPTEEEDAEPVTVEGRNEDQKAALDRLLASLDEAYDTKEKLVRAFGRPASMTVADRKISPHGLPYYTMVETWEYRGFRAEFTSVINAAASETRVFLTELNVFDTREISFLGLQVGRPEADLRTLLGPPRRTQGNCGFYENDDWHTALIGFAVEDGKVVRMAYYSFLD